MTLTTTIERDGREIEIECVLTAHRAHKGARDSINGVRGAGPPLEPDEPASVELESVTVCDTGGDVDLTPNETELVIELAREQLAEESE